MANIYIWVKSLRTNLPTEKEKREFFSQSWYSSSEVEANNVIPKEENITAAFLRVLWNLQQ